MRYASGEKKWGGLGAAAAIALLAAGLSGLPSPAQAAAGDELLGLWATLNDDAVLRVSKCKPQSWMEATSVCVTVVYDSEVNDPNRTTPSDCNRRIGQFDAYENNAWKDGWVFHVGSRKVYRATLRMNAQNQAEARMFVGSAGLTERFKRVNAVPKGCEGKRPDRFIVK